MRKPIRYYVVDAFTSDLFGGNPAGVCVLDEPLPDDLMQSIARENNLSETAFILREGPGYQLRWFTPGFEIDLCGHATLASAFVVLTQLEPRSRIVRFGSVSGPLEVRKRAGRFEMLLPTRPARRLDDPTQLDDILGCRPVELLSERDLYAVLESQEDVEAYVPNYRALLRLQDRWLGVVVTARSSAGSGCDFVSRYFVPELALEDPVTGSSHCTLVPYWSERLGLTELVARQLSPRGGTLYCEAGSTRTLVAGFAKLYLTGELHV